MNELLSLFFVFLRIDLVGFGGGYAMLPLIFQSVQTFDIMSAQEFSQLVALSQITPGPIAINAATYVGFKTAGVLGATSSTLGLILPSFFLVYLIAHFLERFKNSNIIEGAFTGIRPATVGLIGSAVIYTAETSIFNGAFTIENITQMGYGYIEPYGLCIFLAVLLLSGKWNVNPIILTVGGGLIGILIL